MTDIVSAPPDDRWVTLLDSTQAAHLVDCMNWVGRQDELEARGLELVAKLEHQRSLLTMGGDLSHPMNRLTVDKLGGLLIMLDQTLAETVRNRVRCPF